MSNFTKLRKSEGFTIVELLIVVVVIAILAAITIVSYNGITNKANASAAASTASTLQKKAELYAADDDSTTGYPNALSLLTNASKSSKAYYIASGTVKITSAGANPGTTNGKDTVKLVICGTPAGTSNAASKTSVTGIQITYYAWADGLKTVNVGDTSTAANCAPAAS